MREKNLRMSKIYWVAQNGQDVADMRAFRTKGEAFHFVDHRVEGWREGNRGSGWVVFKCYAGTQVSL